jgi:hypothetical protein
MVSSASSSTIQWLPNLLPCSFIQSSKMNARASFGRGNTFAIPLFLFSLQTPSAWAAPVNASNVSPVYVPDPAGRGTVGLVSSCVLTLFLCVYTAIHLNVIPAGTSWRKRLLYQIGWAMLAMFAPEFVLWRAITQWRVARKLCDMMNNGFCRTYCGQESQSQKR